MTRVGTIAYDVWFIDPSSKKHVRGKWYLNAWCELRRSTNVSMIVERGLWGRCVLVYSHVLIISMRQIKKQFSSYRSSKTSAGNDTWRSNSVDKGCTHYLPSFWTKIYIKTACSHIHVPILTSVVPIPHFRNESRVATMGILVFFSQGHDSRARKFRCGEAKHKLR